MEQVNRASVDVENTNLFDLQPGRMLDVQMSHPVAVRVKTMLVGYEIGKYIILKHPNEKKLGSYKDVLVEGNVVIIRYLVEGDRGECFAFRATIKAITQVPEKFLVIDYPKKIESRQLRMQQRITTHIPSEIGLQNDSDSNEARISGLILDISLSGCRFVFKSEQKKQVKRRRINVYINMAGRPESVVVPAEVCNSTFEDGKVFVGIKFNAEEGLVREVMGDLMIEADLLG